MKYVYILLILYLFFSCGKNAEHQKPEEKRKANVILSSSSFDLCYYTIIDKTIDDLFKTNAIGDSIVLKLAIDKDSISGILRYLPNSPNAKIGTFRGKKNKLTTAIFTYRMNGKIQHEEIMFMAQPTAASFCQSDMTKDRNGVLRMKKNNIRVAALKSFICNNN